MAYDAEVACSTVLFICLMVCLSVSCFERRAAILPILDLSETVPPGLSICVRSAVFFVLDQIRRRPGAATIVLTVKSLVACGPITRSTMNYSFRSELTGLHDAFESVGMGETHLEGAPYYDDNDDDDKDQPSFAAANNDGTAPSAAAAAGEFSLASFREELETLTRSLENDVNLDGLNVRVGAQEQKEHEDYQTPDTSFISGYHDSSKAAATTPGPPSPVETPARPPFSSTTNTRGTTRDDGFSWEQFLVREPRDSINDDGDDSFKPAAATTDDDEEEESDWKHLCQQMAREMRQKGNRIHKLERENERLRQQLQPSRQQPERDPGAPPSFSSPGTKFVAELATTMDLPQDYYGPLSRIMDKYYSKNNQRTADNDTAGNRNH